jgi:hypothetical protein
MVSPEFRREEQKALEGIEWDISGVLLGHGILARPFWSSGTGPKGRVIRLVLKEGAILELAPSEIPDLSRDEILSRLRESIERLAI